MNKITKISLISGISGLLCSVVLFLLTNFYELYLLFATVCALFCLNTLFFHIRNKNNPQQITGKEICKRIIDVTVSVFCLYGVIYTLSNTNILTFINNEFLNVVVVMTVALVILGLISFAIDYLFNKWKKREQ
jgi:peptidoglycan biosynthesis protein MviN/MurJ (putative lipid II flippase)